MPVDRSGCDEKLGYLLLPEKADAQLRRFRLLLAFRFPWFGILVGIEGQGGEIGTYGFKKG